MSKASFADQIRHLIETSGQTRYQIWQATGIEQATLSRFMSGKGGLSIPNLNALAAHLGWTVVATDSPKQKTKPKGR